MSSINGPIRKRPLNKISKDTRRLKAADPSTDPLSTKDPSIGILDFEIYIEDWHCTNRFLRTEDRSPVEE